MSVSAASATNLSYLPSAQSGQSSVFAQRRQDFQSLAQALSVGDLSAAQSAFSALQQTFPAAGQDQSVQGGSSPSQSMQSAIQALGQALSQGNLPAAQNAFASLQQGLQQSQGQGQVHGHHHHHHHGGASQPSTALTTTGDTTTSGGSVNTTA